jgi:hypothetical protein
VECRRDRCSKALETGILQGEDSWFSGEEASMPREYSVPTVRELERVFRAQRLIRPLRTKRYEPAQILDYTLTGIWPARRAEVKLRVEKFVGGGFAGQVYKVVLIGLEAAEGPVAGLEKGRAYALKIFVPPSGFARAVRNLIYGIGFQGPFSLQVNPDAARAGALWQKLIRRAALGRFGSERVVVDILGTLVDPVLGSCGELSEWVDGRLWRYEVDDRLFDRIAWKPGRPDEGLGSPEYRAKKAFMSELVGLMHDMGAHELARQYEWWTLKSQPNALKRRESEGDPRGGLVGVDFRAGMVLLPFLPQCPADLKLIARGFARGSLVQFDRGDLNRLEAFLRSQPRLFADMEGALDELKEAERKYRDSLPDITHHHVRLITRPRLWKTIARARIVGWEIRNRIDRPLAEKFVANWPPYLIFFLLGILPALAPALLLAEFPGRRVALWLLWLAPLLGPFARNLWGRSDYRQHIVKLASSLGYVRRALIGRTAERLVKWHRSGRVTGKRAVALIRRPWLFLFNIPLAVLPPGLHRFLTDGAYFRERLDFVFCRPFRLYFRPEVREEWLRDMIAQGEKNGMLTPSEAARILSQIKEPFIQKYLKSMAVHVLTLPVTQIVSVIIAFIYVRAHPEMTWQQSTVAAGLILGLFQVIPLSPGSFARGLYTTLLILKERNFKDYKMAFAISYFKYVGYLAFPLQMAYRYPELARFMAGHWSTGAVHAVPVFGERGAWLEHAVFDLFYNYPLSLGKRIRKRDEILGAKSSRGWAIPLSVILATGLLVLMDWASAKLFGQPAALKSAWGLAVWAPFFGAFAASLWSRRGRMGKRMAAGIVAGASTGLLYAVANTFLSPVIAGAGTSAAPDFAAFALSALWKVFIFTLIAVLGAFVAETRPPSSR